MMDQASLRQAAVQDIPTLLAVTHASFEEYRDRLDPPSGAHSETEETIRQKLTVGHAVLASVNQKIVGCAFYQPAGDHVYLGRLAVLPEYRRRGIGRQLLAWVETQTRSLGYRRVRLSVRVALSGNRAYYERLGYRVISYGTHAGHTAPTFVNLEKEIS
jgi:ribosomal protein S18 acetylase RimI-like enzyme